MPSFSTHTCGKLTKELAEGSTDIRQTAMVASYDLDALEGAAEGGRVIVER